MKIPSSLTVLPVAALLSCSSSRPGIPPLSLRDKLAVVAFHFDGFSDASSAPGELRRVERGPGTSPRVDAASLSDEHAALDSVWTLFEAGLPAALGASILPVKDVASNPAYSEFPARDDPGTKGLEPSGGLRRVSPSDTAKLRNLAIALGATRLLLVECWADYDTTTAGPGLAAPAFAGNIPGWKATDSTKLVKTTRDSSRVARDSARLGRDSSKVVQNSLDSAKAHGGEVAKPTPPAVAKKSVKVVLHVVLRLYQVGQGVYWTGRYMAGTKALAELQAGIVPTSFLPGHLAEAVNPILMRISQDVAIGRGMSD